MLIDGDPALRQVAGSKAMRVVNTRALILLDESTGTYYLHVMGRWVSAKSVLGPWAAAPQAPAEFESVKQSLARDNAVDLLDPKNPGGAPKDLPAIYVSTTPAELIQSVGEPEYTPIAGTSLLYMLNTDSPVFRLTSSQDHYVLISGRWFKAASLQGPWSYVAGTELPADFQKIPPDSPKANVLVSVPGTSRGCGGGGRQLHPADGDGEDRRGEAGGQL